MAGFGQVRSGTSGMVRIRSPVAAAMALATAGATAMIEVSPALKFLIAHQQVELSPEDAQRLEIGSGDAVEVASNGTAVQGTAVIRSAVPRGTVFLADGISSESANALTEPSVELRKR